MRDWSRIRFWVAAFSILETYQEAIPHWPDSEYEKMAQRVYKLFNGWVDELYTDLGGEG